MSTSSKRPKRKKRTKPRAPTEAQEAIALARWMRHHGVVFVHVPNEGKRSGSAGMYLKMMGMQPGFPDYLILTQPHCAIELKRRTRENKCTPKQTAWLTILKTIGWHTHVAFGAKEAVEFLKGLGYGRLDVDEPDPT